MQVMQCDQAKPENFFRLDEMPDVTARKFTAGVADAVFFNGILVQDELCVFQIDRACRSEGRSISGESCRQDAIEHVHPTRDQLQQLGRRTEPHGVTRFVPRQQWLSPFDSSHHFIFRFSDAHAADGVTVEAHRHQFFGAFLAQRNQGRQLPARFVFAGART